MFCFGAFACVAVSGMANAGLSTGVPTGSNQKHEPLKTQLSKDTNQ
jgi:hypothetical protein